ncbi:hypothetical protein K8R47_02120 [archaeon]|nr:hypothetical protein [archaeon]
MNSNSSLDLNLVEILAIALPIPLNTIGYVAKNRTEIMTTMRFYWNYKKNRYWEIVDNLQESEQPEDFLESRMPIVCYRMMVRLAINRIDNYCSNDFGGWAKKYPIDWDLSFNLKHVPKDNK